MITKFHFRQIAQKQVKIGSNAIVDDS